MGHAEDGIDELRIGSTDLELQQRCFHRIDGFKAFFEESVVKLCEIQSHD